MITTLGGCLTRPGSGGGKRQCKGPAPPRDCGRARGNGRPFVTKGGGFGPQLQANLEPTTVRSIRL